MQANLIKKSLVAVAVFAALGAGSAQASGNIDVTVNATIVGVCKFNTQTPVVNITNTGTGSNIDPSLSTTATGSVGITYRCSNGTSPTFVVPPTATVTCGSCSGSPTMTPAISSTGGGAGSGMGGGQDKTLTVTGDILSTSYVNAAAGAYSGIINISVTP